MIRFPNRLALSLQAARLGGLGKVPFAPGTVATVAAGIPAACFLNALGKPLALLVLAILLALSCYSAEVAEREIGKTDPGEVVIDELVGFLITVFGFAFTWETLMLGVVSFRLMDIWKPWPVRLMEERLKGGIAIVMDDVMAGILAHGLVWVGLRALG